MTIKHISVLVLLVLLLAACGPEATPEVTGPAVFIRTDVPTLTVGERTTLRVDMQSIVYLAGVDIVLVYDPNMLAVVTSEVAGAAQVTDLVNPEFQVMNIAQDGELQVVYASSVPSDTPDGTLFTFEVEPLAKGTTTLRFVTVKLAGQGGAPIEAVPVDLRVKVK